jgi:hypothetical protein
MNEPANRIDTAVLCWGAALIVAGLVITLVNLDLVGVTGLASFWPLLVVGAGLFYLVVAPTMEKRRNGLWIAVIGGWLLLNTLRVFGLFWHDSWPLMIVLAGLFDFAWPAKGEKRAGNLVTISIGVWLTMVVTLDWLDWRTAWPLLLVLIGLSMITGALWRALPAFLGGRS